MATSVNLKEHDEKLIETLKAARITAEESTDHAFDIIVRLAHLKATVTYRSAQEIVEWELGAAGAGGEIALPRTYNDDKWWGQWRVEDKAKHLPVALMTAQKCAEKALVDLARDIVAKAESR